MNLLERIVEYVPTIAKALVAVVVSWIGSIASYKATGNNTVDPGEWVAAVLLAAGAGLAVWATRNRDEPVYPNYPNDPQTPP
jgi:hypothetical protein